MKKVFYQLFLVVSLSALLAACGGGSSSTVVAPPETGVVHVTSDITTPTTWTSNNVYVLDNSIATTATLTIKPGTIVKFSQGTSISVNAGGKIVADGQSATTPIIFTSVEDDAFGGDTNGDASGTAPAAGNWRYVNVTQSGSVFNFCRFYYGGGNAPYVGTLALNNDCTATVTNCVFAHNKGGTLSDTRAAALNAGGAAAGTVITGNTFYDNEMPLVVNGLYDVDNTNVFHQQVSGSTVTNKYNGIFFSGPYVLTGNITWSNTDVPYVILGALSVEAGSLLTLSDDVIVKFDAGERIDVSGALIADATNGIVFTSIKDDSMGGDTNGDGAATAPAPGDWKNVSVWADGSVFDHCRFFFGGSGKPYSGTLEVSNDSSSVITNCTFAHNAGGAPSDNRAATVNLGGAGAGTVMTGNTFYDNDMPMVINGYVSIDNSNVFHSVISAGTTTLYNKYNGIFMDGTSHAVTGNITWAGNEVAFVINDTDLSVEPGAVLTLGDGVVLKFAASGSILLSGDGVHGTGSISEGTGVYYTSIFDDARLGDSNGDGGITLPAKGDWDGINRCPNAPCTWQSWANILYAANP